MTNGPSIVVDACVLANFSLCDTLLRLAESPQLFEPKWSEEIIHETVRTLESKLGWPRGLTMHFQHELRVHFGEAWVQDYESLLPDMTNDGKDRHVLAAAVRCGAPVIVTFNLRHFRDEHTKQWGVHAMHPQNFLVHLLDNEQDIVLSKLPQQAADRNRSLSQLLAILNKSVPDFAAAVANVTSRK